MSLTKIQPSGLDETKGYAVDSLTANTIISGGTDVSSVSVTANASLVLAQGAFTAANTNTGNITTLQGVNDAQNTSITAVSNYSVASYNEANTASTVADNAYLQSLAGIDSAQAAYNTANSATSNPLIAAAFTQANAATNSAQASYNTANTDYTTLSVTEGVYGGSSNIPVITLAANGRVSSIVNTAISIPAGTSVYGNTGQITANSATGTVALGLETTAVTAGTYGGESQVPVIVIDAYGRITSAANVASAGGGGGGGVTVADDTTTNSDAYYPMLSTITTGSLSTATTSSTELYFNPSTGTLNSTIFNSLSDKNFKTELVQINDALDKLKTLTGYVYTITESGERSAGLLSQDVQQVLPEAVRENDGKQSLNYNATIGLIVESIKILSDKVDLITKRLG